MFTQGRIRVIALAVADALCIVAMWAVAAWGYWVLGGFLRTHGWPGCSWGGYELGEYLRFAPIALVFVCVNSALNLYHGNWMYPSAPQSPVEEFRRLCISSLLTHASAIAYMAFTYQNMGGRISRAVCVYACILTAVGSQSFRNWMRFAMKRLNVGQIPVVLAGSGEAAHRFAAVLDGDPYAGIRIVGYFAGTERIGRSVAAVHGTNGTSRTGRSLTSARFATSFRRRRSETSRCSSPARTTAYSVRKWTSLLRGSLMSSICRRRGHSRCSAHVPSVLTA